jgi:hypothetical protein
MRTYPPNHFFLLRSGTTVTRVGMTASLEIGLLGEVSFLGFLASLVERCSLPMVSPLAVIQLHGRHRRTRA